MSGKHSCDERMGGKTMAREKREVEIKSRADTLPLTSPEVRPWPVTPPPPPEEVTKVYEKRKAGEFGKWCEDNLRFEKGFVKAEALQGFKVLDIGLWRMGHKFASSLLGEAGAEVICIEPPGGDPMRELTPFGREEYMRAEKETGGVGARGSWGPYKDRGSKHGQWELDPFSQCTNSFVHNTGFPQDQLPRGKGGDPTRSGLWINDFVAGEQAAANIQAALYWRDQFTEEGRCIE